MSSPTRVVVSALLSVVMSATALAAQGATDDAKAFGELIARAKRADASVDFDRLRRLSTKLDSYTGDFGTSAPLFAAVEASDFAKARSLSESSLESNYLNVDAQMVATIACRQLGDTAAADQHLFVARGIIDSIMGSGDGRSHDTAWFVIAVGEEYAVCRALELTVTNQRLDHSGGHTYDVLSVKDAEGHDQGDVYFVIDTIWAAEQRMFTKKTK